MFTLSLIFAVLILVLSIKSIYFSIFSKEADERYFDADIVIQYDEYSPSRFINKRALEDQYDTIDMAVSFFNLQVLSTIDGNSHYLTLISTLPHEFERLIDIDIDLIGHEVILTESTAEQYQLDVGDTLSFSIFDQNFDYQITDIIPNQGLLGTDCFFVDKSVLLDDLFGLGSLSNFGNVIYVYSSDYTTVYSQLTTSLDYQDYAISMVQDTERIQGMVNEYTSMIVVAGILVIIALFLVLDSLFLIVLKTIFRQISVFDTLGDTKNLGYRVCFHQWGYYVIVSFLVSLVLAQVVIAFGGYFYGIHSFIGVNPWMAMIGLVAVILYIVVRNSSLMHRYSHQSAIVKIKKPQPVLRFSPKFLSLVFIVDIGLLLMIIGLQPFDPSINGLLIVFLSLYASLVMLVAVVRHLGLLQLKKTSIFKMVNITHMKTNEFIHDSMRILFLAFIVVTILFSVRSFLTHQINDLVEQFDVDILIMNLHQDDDQLIESLSHDDIDHLSMGCFYREVSIHMGDDSSLLRYMVSMNRTDYSYYFQYPLDDVPTTIESHQYPYVLLPKTYELVYKLDVGDIITIDLSPKLRNVSFVVGGFVNSEFDHFAYTNLAERSFEEIFEYNTIFIDSSNPDAAIPYLVEEVSSDMMVVINAKSLLNQQMTMADNVLALFTVMSMFIIASFLLVVFNNTSLKFDALKSDYAKLRVLGYDRRQLKKHLFLEWLLISLTIGFVGVIEILILSKYMRYLLLFFDYFKNLSATSFSIFLSLILISGCLFLSYMDYYRKIMKYPIANEIKTF